MEQSSKQIKRAVKRDPPGTVPKRSTPAVVSPVRVPVSPPPLPRPSPTHSNDGQTVYYDTVQSIAVSNDEQGQASTHHDDFVRSSLSSATRTYNAYIRNGGVALTSKRSIDTTPVVVRVPPSNVRVLPSNERVTPPNAPPIRPSFELVHPQQQKYDMMVNRLVSELGYPHGLAKRLVSCTQTQYVKHYWLVDNSESLMKARCSQMVQRNILEVGGSHAKKLHYSIKCNRWKELQNTLLSQIDLADILEVPTTIRMLQGYQGVQEFTINQVAGDAARAKSGVSRTRASGTTQLSRHINDVCDQIEQDKDLLIQNGQKAVVVIATDAMPTDMFGETSEAAKTIFLNTVRKLQLLPVWIVIRLCTNDRRTMAYYRKLDQQLEIPIECVSDYITESKEVRRYNPWLNYSRHIHQCREVGFDHRVFDLLDECPLSKDDLYDFLTVLFGAEAFDTSTAPSMFTDWNHFLEYLQGQILPMLSEKQYSPITKKMEDIIDVKGLAKAHGIFGSMRQTLHRMVDV